MRTSFFKTLTAPAFAAGSAFASASTFSNIDVRQGQTMARQGFKSAHNVQGGMIAWGKAGLPVAR